MLKSKNIIVKVGSTIFFSLMAIMMVIAFGASDFLDNLRGTNPSNFAVINGEDVSIFDYNFFLAGSGLDSSQADNPQVQEYFINRVLSTQFSKQSGVRVTKEAVLKYMRDTPYFQNEEGKFDEEQMNNFLENYNMSFDQFYDISEEQLYRIELYKLLGFGIGLAPEDIQQDEIVKQSKLEIEYGYLTNELIKERYPDRTAVSDAEVDAKFKEMQDVFSKNEDALEDKSVEELVNLATTSSEPTKEQARNSLELAKLSEVKKGIVTEINTLVSEGKSFSEALAYLNLEAKKSKEFKLGDPVYDSTEQGAILYELYSNGKFNQDLLNLEFGTLAAPVSSDSGVFIFTPTKREIALVDVKDVSYDSKSALLDARAQELEKALLEPFIDKSRIVRKGQ